MTFTVTWIAGFPFLTPAPKARHRAEPIAAPQHVPTTHKETGGPCGPERTPGGFLGPVSHRGTYLQRRST